MHPTQRFSTRVEDYVRYRPGYPKEICEALARDAGWTPVQTVADIGAGTGILTAMLLDRGNTVFAVEPNDSMRAASEKTLAANGRFRSVKGTAEETTLTGGCVDGITVAQAFHWFDRSRARDEFRRILRPGGWLALLWNERLVDSTPFMRAYERMIEQWSVDYDAVKERDLSESEVREFFAPHAPVKSELPNFQSFDFEGALGRLMSSSYAPQQGHAKYEPIVAEMRRIFDEHQREGRVRFEYRTAVYAGRFV
jgi:SAM-dependent methyltransferase